LLEARVELDGSTCTKSQPAIYRSRAGPGTLAAGCEKSGGAMKQRTTGAESGKQWRFMVVAAVVGALTLVSGLWLGAWSASAPVMGEAEATLMAQTATDTAADRAAFEFSYATPSVNRK
jgi:hypothetical protein